MPFSDQGELLEQVPQQSRNRLHRQAPLGSVGLGLLYLLLSTGCSPTLAPGIYERGSSTINLCEDGSFAYERIMKWHHSVSSGTWESLGRGRVKLTSTYSGFHDLPATVVDADTSRRPGMVTIAVYHHLSQNPSVYFEVNGVEYPMGRDWSGQYGQDSVDIPHQLSIRAQFDDFQARVLARAPWDFGERGLLATDTFVVRSHGAQRIDIYVPMWEYMYRYRVFVGESIDLRTRSTRWGTMGIIRRDDREPNCEIEEDLQRSTYLL